MAKANVIYDDFLFCLLIKNKGDISKVREYVTETYYSVNYL